MRKAAAAFLCFSVAPLIVDRPLQKATALLDDGTACLGSAACASGRSGEAWKSAERPFAASFVLAFSLWEVR